MTFKAFLRRVTRQDEIDALKAEIAQLRGYVSDIQHTLDSAEAAHEALTERVKELEEADHLEDEDIDKSIDTWAESDEFGRKLGDLIDEQLSKQDPWNDPSFTGQADEWLSSKFKL